MATKTKQITLEKNKIKAKDTSAHDWYNFVLSFPPHLVRSCLLRFGSKKNDLVLDPFCGTGTTLVECRKLGFNSIGVEANPITSFASTVKLNWEVDPEGLYEHATRISVLVSRRLKRDGFSADGDLHKSNQNAKLKSISQDSYKLLLMNSISPIPLHKTLRLLEAIEEKRDNRFYDHERLALANGLVSGISNLRFGPEVGVGKTKYDAPVIPIWMKNIRSMRNDLLELSSFPKTKSVVIHDDSRRIASVLGGNKVDAVITSPPYPNEKDYTRTTRLESVLLGFISDKKELRLLKQGLLRSNSRGVYKHDDDDSLVSGNIEIQRIADKIERRRIELGKTSGFERMYARATKLYFGGMTKHLSDLRKILNPGAQLAYVVGDQASYLKVMIRTGKLLSDIASSLGYKVIGIDLFRTRLATATKEQLREEVVLLEWPG